MQKLISISTLLLAVCFIGCDKIKDPIVVKNTTVGTTFITKSNATVSNFKKILLEDYTGHQCGNCPPAAVVADDLSAQYKDTVVVIAVHAGFFTKTNSTFVTSYTTTAGNDWDGTAGFGVSGAGNPNGMVNRKDYGSGKVKKETSWASYALLAKSDPFVVKLDVTTNYDATVRVLNTTVKAKFKTAYPTNTSITLVITEDSIVGPQKDYSKNPDVIDDYEFKHMLRGDVNGSFGTTLKNTPIAANDSISLAFNNFSIKSNYNDKHIYLVAFVSNSTTREVLQVEKVKIR